MRTIVNNASLTGWGAHLELLKLQGLELEKGGSLHINVLEICAIYSACKTFQDHIRDSVVLILHYGGITGEYLSPCKLRGHIAAY